MSSKIAAEVAAAAVVVVREYDEETDKRDVEEMERECDETGPHGKPVMVSDLLGDPVRRVRHFPCHTMLVNHILTSSTYQKILHNTSTI